MKIKFKSPGIGVGEAVVMSSKLVFSLYPSRLMFVQCTRAPCQLFAKKKSCEILPIAKYRKVVEFKSSTESTG
jgi:hypothetical protein